MRLHSIDFVRGLALTIVLIDHVDYWAGPAGFLRNWTLMGLGFSDAAEALMFLSGFTFGWAYSPRMSQDGFFACQRRVLVRTFQIYASYLAVSTVITTSEITLQASSPTLHTAIVASGPAAYTHTLTSAVLLKHQPFSLGILCTYVAILPFLPLTLLIRRASELALIEISFCLYLIAGLGQSINLKTDLGDGWYFNPFSWQFLIVIGMCCGCRFRSNKNIVPFNAALTLLATLVVVSGVLARKSSWLLLPPSADISMWKVLNHPLIGSKSYLGPLRIIHFASIAYFISNFLSRMGDPLRRHPLATPFIACGRHPLFAYCTGVVIAYWSRHILQINRGSNFNITIAVSLAVFLQFLLVFIVQKANYTDSRSKLRFPA